MSKYWYSEIHINIDMICTNYEQKEYEGDTSDDET